MDFVSALIDWRFAPKWDLYFGVDYNWVTNGFAQLGTPGATPLLGQPGNSFLNHYNIDPTLGMRFRF